MLSTCILRRGCSGLLCRTLATQPRASDVSKRPGDNDVLITPRSVDYSKWYLDVLVAADLVDLNTPVKGCCIIKPNGYAIWEQIRDTLDAKLKATGHVNAYFPTLIPTSFLSQEAAHVDGFAKECAVVTHHRLTVASQGEAANALDTYVLLHSCASSRVHSCGDVICTFSSYAPYAYVPGHSCVRARSRVTHPLIGSLGPYVSASLVPTAPPAVLISSLIPLPFCGSRTF